MMGVLAAAGFWLATSMISVPTPPGVPSTDVTAHHGVVYQTRDAGEATQGFIDIVNVGADDELTGATCPLAGTTSLVGPDGNPLANVAVPARQTLSLSAGGPHLLLQNTHFSVDFGGVVPCSLIFANAGTISVFLYATPAP
jgi:copper(I)-binding protein